MTSERPPVRLPDRPGTPAEMVDQRCPATTWYFEAKGSRVAEAAARWAVEIADLVAEVGGGNRRLAVDQLGPNGFAPLLGHGLALLDAQRPLELVRAIKSADEIAAMRVAILVCEAGIEQMHRALRPGITENALWSELIQGSLARGAEAMETRLLASGRRTYPWYRECGEKVIAAGELVAFDTDMISAHGLCADISRTWLCGPATPTAEQRRLYSLAHDQIRHNIGLIRPGMTFRELADAAWPIPDAFLASRYGLVAHGVGMADEYPDIVHPLDWTETGYDGVIAAGSRP